MTDNIEDTGNIEFFDGGDFVLTKNKEGKIISGGYKIDSFFLEGDTPLMTTYNKIDQYGGKVSSQFENLAVPAGLFYINTKVPKKDIEIISDKQIIDHKMAPDEMIDKLFKLIEFDKKRKRKTKKNNIKQNKKITRRHK